MRQCRLGQSLTDLCGMFPVLSEPCRQVFFGCNVI
jgi:hypothetical protein